MQAPRALLIEMLRNPGVLGRVNTTQWEQLIACNRRHGLAGRWYDVVAKADAIAVSSEVMDQLRAEHTVAAQRLVTTRWEVRCVAAALHDLPLTPVLLKGAAYMLAGLPCGWARMVADVDILVPRTQLLAVEAALQRRGWRTQAEDAYDDAYFRRWMHEIPPMQHHTRGTVVDVHHNILPLTSRLCPDPESLLKRAVPLAGSDLCTLHPVDMLLHAIVHGFQDGEFLNGLRDVLDVLDVHELAEHFGSESFWEAFVQRTLALGFERPVWYALTTAKRVFQCAVPDRVIRALAHARPGFAAAAVFRCALERVLVPSMPPTRPERIAARIMQVRSHWNKMPVTILARHLGYKIWLRMRRRLTSRSGVAPAQ